MANQYFNKTFKPDIINGTVANVIASNKDQHAFAGSDILFDWQAVDVPLGTDSIVDGLVHMIGVNGSVQADVDVSLLIAKSKDGIAPTSLGSVNSGVSGCYEMSEVLMAVMKFEGDTNRQGILHIGFGSAWHFGYPGQSGHTGPIVIEPESNSLGGSTTNRIYVAGIAGGALDFATNVQANYVSGAPGADSTTSIVTDNTDPRKSFRPGDVVYVHDLDTALGTVSSLTANGIELTANNAVAVANNDEMMNATPITITLGFRGR